MKQTKGGITKQMESFIGKGESQRSRLKQAQMRREREALGQKVKSEDCDMLWEGFLIKHISLIHIL